MTAEHYFHKMLMELGDNVLDLRFLFQLSNYLWIIQQITSSYILTLVMEDTSLVVCTTINLQDHQCTLSAYSMHPSYDSVAFCQIIFTLKNDYHMLQLNVYGIDDKNNTIQ